MTDLDLAQKLFYFIVALVPLKHKHIFCMNIKLCEMSKNNRNKLVLGISSHPLIAMCKKENWLCCFYTFFLILYFRNNH